MEVISLLRDIYAGRRQAEQGRPQEELSRRDEHPFALTTGHRSSHGQDLESRGRQPLEDSRIEA